MAQNTVNTGTVANDGTGDTLRSAFIKINEDITELFSGVANNEANIASLVITVDTSDGELLALSSMAFDTANQAYDFSNAQYTAMNAAFTMANTVNSLFYGAVVNSAAAFAMANSTVVRTNAIYTLTNSGYTVANAAFNLANTLNPTALAIIANGTAAFEQANLAFQLAGQAYDLANVDYVYSTSAIVNAAAAFGFANGVSVNTAASYRVANSAYNVTNASFGITNSVYYKTNSAYAAVNSAFALANTKLPINNGTATGLFTAEGNVYVYGTTFLNSGNYTFGNSLVSLNKPVYINTTTNSGSLFFYDDSGINENGRITANGSYIDIKSISGFVSVTSPSGLYVDGNIYSNKNIYAYYSSDIKFKENVVNIPDALQKLKSLNGVFFDWSDEWIQSQGGEDGYFIRKHDVGLIAQEIKEVLPEAVVVRKDGSLAVNYEKVIPLLIETIKHLSDEVDRLKNAIS